jgi:predicted small lipoprotein YifL
MLRSISTLRTSALVLLASAALTACGGPLQYAPKGTPKAPEADAHVTADVDAKASMTHLTVTAEHLAPPGRLQDGGTTYVLWTRKNDGGQWTRIGALQYDEGARKAELKAASVPLTAFDLVVSIEKQAAPESPSGDIVLQQRVQD